MTDQSPQPDDAPQMSEERKQQLLDEAGRTVSGLDPAIDPRAPLVIEEEQARLDRIAEELLKATQTEEDN